jgi:outer membrane protein TolC
MAPVRRLLALGVVVSSVLAAGRARAEESLPLDAAVREALAAGPAAAAARAAPRVAAAERAAAALAFPDGLELSLGGASDVLTSRDGEYALDAAIAADLGAPFRRGRRVAAADALVASARAEADRALLEHAARAARAWVALLRADRLRTIARERAAATAALASAVDARFAKGDASELEQLEAALDVARTAAQGALADGAVAAAAEELAALLGRTSGAELRAGPAPAVPALPADADALLAAAVAARPDLAAIARAADAARARARLARSGAVPWPRLELGVSATRSVLEPTAFAGDPVLAGDLGTARDTGVLLGVRLAVPLAWTGGPGNAARLALAEAALADARLAAATRAARAEIAAAFARAAASERAAASLSTAESAATRALDLLGKAYSGGEVGVIDLLVAKDRVFATRESLAAAEAERLGARIDLALALGRTFPELP